MFRMEVHSTRELAAAVQARRKELGLNQEDLATMIGVSRRWIIDLEKAKPTVELQLVFLTLKVLGLVISLAPPNESKPGSGTKDGGDDIDLDEVLRQAQGP